MQEATAEGIVKGDVLQWLARPSLIVGGIVLIVFNVLFPRVDDPDDKMMLVQSIADNNGGFYELTNLLLAAGFILMMIGIIGIYRSISVGGGAAWVRMGFYGVTMGTTL
jgi:hypothetical protein